MTILKKILGAPSVQTALLTALVLVVMLWPISPLEHLENKNFDFWASHFRSPENQSIAIVAIDEKSIRQIGDWPWPRSKIAEMVRFLSSEGADALGICLLYTHPDLNPGLLEIRDLKTQVADQKWIGKKRTIKILEGMLNGAARRLNHDAQLITAIRRAQNVVLPIRFTTQVQPETGNGKPSGLLIINSIKPPQVASESAQSPTTGADSKNGVPQAPMHIEGVQETFGTLAGKSGGLGHLNFQEDPDGMLRRVPLLVDYKERLLPAFALQLALKHIGARLRNLTIHPDSFGKPNLRIRHLKLSTDNYYQMLLNYDPKWTQERTYSFIEVLDGTLDPDIFSKKIVLIGVTDEATAQSYRVGAHGRASNVEINANVVARILSTDRLSRPSWAQTMEIVVLFYFAFFLIVVIPRVNIRIGASILGIFIATWYVVGVGLLMGYGYWVKMYGPILLACGGFVLYQCTTYSLDRQEDKLEINKTLGLSYQGQGMLDMAYEKFMQCPVKDASAKNLLYNLGLDFERKRMFNKALAIYQHIHTDGTFKDIKDRIRWLKATENPLGRGGGTRIGEATLSMETEIKPTFGRYTILKALGQGSMGTVYLGRDPKINREVAIKTLEYTEVQASELTEVKARLYREAEAAGKLSHPNIVAIYDAGEEHDMAYIAMELLNGEDLTRHCAKDNLLPATRIMKIISNVTDALDYAHSHGVVHRDIKPANIMLLEDDRVKVTDFGIARVVDASMTRTGSIVGTPSYMSPEQVNGKGVDGRTDLFSLGIVFYELLAGSKPFKGDSITTIMYAISQNAHTPLSEAVPEIPAGVEAIVDKMLAKEPANRYHSAADVSKAIENCLAEMK